MDINSLRAGVPHHLHLVGSAASGPTPAAVGSFLMTQSAFELLEADVVIGVAGL